MRSAKASTPPAVWQASAVAASFPEASSSPSSSSRTVYRSPARRYMEEPSTPVHSGRISISSAGSARSSTTSAVRSLVVLAISERRSASFSKTISPPLFMTMAEAAFTFGNSSACAFGAGRRSAARISETAHTSNRRTQEYRPPRFSVFRTISTALLSSAYYAQKLFFYLSPFCLAMKASTLSMTTGTRSMMRSTVLLAGGVTLIMRITPSLMTRKPMGLIFTPVALPPP